MKFYTIHPHWPESWGDFGSIVVHGYATYRSSDDGICRVVRTGPTIPDITLPGVNVVIIRDSFRIKLENSFFNNACDFEPVVKKHIVDFPWDFSQSAMTMTIPENFGGSMDSWLDESPHSDSASQALGALWVWRMQPGAYCDIKYHSGNPFPEVILDESSWSGAHIFNLKIASRPGAAGKLAVDDIGKMWFDKNCNGAVLFNEIAVQS